MKQALAFFLLTVTAFAGEPRIVGSIESDTSTIKVKQNDPPWISLRMTDVPDGAISTWAGPVGEGKVGFHFKDGVGLATGLPGTYQFRVIVQVPKDGPDEISVYESTVIVEGVGPVPPPPPDPVPVEDFTTKLTNAVKAKPAETHAELTRAANTYSAVADQAKSGLLTEGSQVVALTDGLLTFMPAFADIKRDVVDPHVESLKLSKAADCEPVWRQIAAAIKAGLTDIPPPPDVDPLPVTSLHVMVIEEMDDRAKLPASQVDIFTSTELRKWLTDNGVQWRMFDDDTDLSHAEQKWQDAMKRERTQVPWLVASNGRAGYEGPLPKSVGDLIALLEKYR